MPNRRTISAGVSYKIWRLMRRHSKETGVSLNAILTQLIEEYMAKNNISK
jgi:macrodomain Ter protein organizer (MatP/YcbG family)